jgi:catechol 2,3-dioxygenase-like lactoylglutathione lyase family enzyme
MIAAGVHHISFAVQDLERSRAFYEDLLGLVRIPRPEFGVPGYWFRAGNTEVHLIQTPPGQGTGRGPDKLSPLANHQAFAIRDYAAARDALRAQGVEIMETSPERGQFWVRDPDANILEFIVQPKES